MKKKILIGSIAAVSAAMVALGGYTLWHYRLPKFQDVTMELGSPLPGVKDFLTADAQEHKAKLITGENSIDLSQAGVQELTFTHGRKEETVKLTIVDTTAPVLKLRDVSADIGTELTVEDFVVEAKDYAPVSLSLTQPLEEPEGYGDVTVEVTATDASGNCSRGQCTLSYIWMRSSLTMELGSSVSKEDILMNAQKDGDLLSQEELDQLTAAPVGTYPISATTVDGKTGTCEISVVDTVAPSLNVKDVTVYEGEPVSLEDFLESAWDLSGDVVTRWTQEPTTAQAGTYPVTLEAEDCSGNLASAAAQLTVCRDTEPPVFSGLKKLSTDQGEKPNYTAGVSARDNRDGTVTFEYDDSQVDLSNPGVYQVTYTARDRAGNVATQQRKLVVNHDQADTKALVQSVAAGLSSDPEAIRDYVRSSIKYSSSWGEDDPVWYGFKNKKGNCYVHALCLQELLKEKGYSTKLIWVTDKSHYWLQIQLGGSWKHIDATPGTRHTKYSLMNDQQRLETLSGRTWDTTQWPACE